MLMVSLLFYSMILQLLNNSYFRLLIMQQFLLVFWTLLLKYSTINHFLKLFSVYFASFGMLNIILIHHIISSDFFTYKYYFNKRKVQKLGHYKHQIGHTKKPVNTSAPGFVYSYQLQPIYSIFKYNLTISLFHDSNLIAIIKLIDVSHNNSLILLLHHNIKAYSTVKGS